MIVSRIIKMYICRKAGTRSPARTSWWTRTHKTEQRYQLIVHILCFHDLPTTSPQLLLVDSRTPTHPPSLRRPVARFAALVALGRFDPALQDFFVLVQHC